jgi:hypothetical protein
MIYWPIFMRGLLSDKKKTPQISTDVIENTRKEDTLKTLNINLPKIKLLKSNQFLQISFV